MIFKLSFLKTVNECPQTMGCWSLCACNWEATYRFITLQTIALLQTSLQRIPLSKLQAATTAAPKTKEDHGPPHSVSFSRLISYLKCPTAQAVGCSITYETHAPSSPPTTSLSTDACGSNGLLCFFAQALRTKGQLDSTSCHAAHQLQFGGQIVY
jgi:hypothetical protein